MKGWRAPILDQIRALQRSAANFYIELDNGRIVQVYEPATVATTEDCLGILSNRSGFEIIAAEHIVAVGSGVHPTEEEKRRQRLTELEGQFGK
jgi:hypothetical protein